jgi:hypothetical protein
MSELQQKLARRRNLNGEKTDGGSKETVVPAAAAPVNPPPAVANAPSQQKSVPVKEQKTSSAGAVDELQAKLFRRRSLNGEINGKVQNSSEQPSTNNTSPSVTSAPTENSDALESNKQENISSTSNSSSSSIPADAANNEPEHESTASIPPQKSPQQIEPEKSTSENNSSTSSGLLTSAASQVENSNTSSAQPASESANKQDCTDALVEVNKDEAIPAKGPKHSTKLLEELSKDSEFDEFFTSKPLESKGGMKKGKPVSSIFLDDDDDGEIIFKKTPPAVPQETAASVLNDNKGAEFPKSLPSAPAASPSIKAPSRDSSLSPKPSRRSTSESNSDSPVPRKLSTSSRTSSLDNNNTTGSEKNISTTESSSKNSTNSSGGISPRQPQTPRQSSTSSTDSAPSSSKWYPGKYLMERRTPWSAKNNKIAINAEQAQHMYNDFVAHGRTKSVEGKDSAAALLAASLASDVEKYAATKSSKSHESAQVESSTFSARSMVPSVSFRRRSNVHKEYTIAELLEENEMLREEVERLRNELETKQAIIDAYESTAGLSSTEVEGGEAISEETRSTRDKRVSVVLTTILGPDPTLPAELLPKDNSGNIEDIDLDAIASKTTNIRTQNRGERISVGALDGDYSQDRRQLIAAIDAASETNSPAPGSKKALATLGVLDGEEELEDATTANIRRRGGGRLFDDEAANMETQGGARKGAFKANLQDLLKDPSEEPVNESDASSSVAEGGKELDTLLADAKLEYNPTQSAASEKDLIRSYVSASSGTSNRTSASYNKALLEHGLVTATPAKPQQSDADGTDGSKTSGDLFDSSAVNNEKNSEDEDSAEVFIL